MKFSSVFLSTIISTPLVLANPTASPFDPLPVATQCTNIRMPDVWLVADCLTGADATTRMTSGMFLNNKTTNDDGSLTWDTRYVRVTNAWDSCGRGEFFNSCNQCTLSATAILTCTCKTSDDTEAVFRFYGPERCFVPSVYFPDHFVFSAMKLIREAAWELKGYADEGCTQLIHTLGPGVCKVVDEITRLGLSV
ncbi:hypothetical protein K504DRAFT_535717 [Pleomassaria siparia CBS 279.74]|uniref:Cyanovirin-N domain-containing protein n=1 Tax=Pleomassaria siparia CBS 279.74 TaxID=1314801 RepID=A0A6G1K3K0_9PLEO|nr:hypothetical protein K504DRAFT_535717 [Pleomassaria siparia CBS 279.74]